MNGSYFVCAAKLRLDFSFVLAMVLMHLAQTASRWPPTFLVWRLRYCLLMVFILEWEREASLVEPRPQTSHFFAIIISQLIFI